MRKSSLFFFLSIVSACLFAQKPMTVYAGRPGPSVSPTMWGIFFEDINFGADGGLYAELVKNRSFEFPMPMTGWKEIKKSGTGKILVVNQEKRKPVQSAIRSFVGGCGPGLVWNIQRKFSRTGDSKKGDLSIFTVGKKQKRLGENANRSGEFRRRKNSNCFP
jgi:hypothetical protein